ncbi:sugar nucleotide-binding protein, partial [Luteimonas sp. TWI662]|uniref:sugar nucleotide-binding protein n=1 Tax=Luteimonas sp. TWI662 TaxID=3136789 RepID=UPI00320A34FF
FAEAIFEGALARGLIARAPTVEPITTADYPTPAKRPAYSRLDTGALERDFGVVLPDWKDTLDGVFESIDTARL